MKSGGNLSGPSAGTRVPWIRDSTIWRIYRSRRSRHSGRHYLYGQRQRGFRLNSRKDEKQRATLQRSCYAETDEVISVAGSIHVAPRRASSMRIVVPGSATHCPKIAVARCPGAAVPGIVGVGGAPAVLSPLPYVAIHVVEAPRIGCKMVAGHRGFAPFSLWTAAIGDVAIVVRLFSEMLEPHQNGVVDPARATYSRSASDSSRYVLPVTVTSQST